MDASGWAVIITTACLGIGGIVTSAVTLVLTYYREAAKIKRDDEREEAKLKRDEAVAKKVEEVAAENRRTKEEVKKEVKEVRDVLRETTDITTGKLDEGLKINRATHTLVNKETSEKLLKIRDRSKLIYELSPIPEYEVMFKEDERLLLEHLDKQARVDKEYGEAAAKNMGTSPTT